MTAPSILAQTREDRVRALGEHAVEVRSVDPRDDDFSDLEQLRELFASSRVVLLGEQSHGDGATFLAKARLVRFLHQEMGFNVLAFESGFFDCREAEARLEVGVPAVDAVPLCLFPIWTTSAQVRPTLDYLEQTHASDRPLHLAGFDSQMTGTASFELLADGLQGVAEAVQSEFDWDVYGEFVRDLTRDQVGLGTGVLPPEGDRRALDAALSTLNDEIAASPLPDRSFWAQVSRSLRAQLATVYAMSGADATVESVSIRDRQMAENFMWLLELGHPNEKLIVWAHTGHVARSLAGIETGSIEDDDLYNRWRPMGSYLSERLGNEMYTVGFIAHEGEWGLPFGGPPVPLAPPTDGSLEALLADTELDFAIVDLRGAEESVSWLMEPIQSGPIGYEPMTAVWSDVVDGLFFTRVMVPSIPVEP